MSKEDVKLIVALEVGTSKVVAIVGQVLPDGVADILGVGVKPSRGIDRGSITDLDAVVNSIKRAIEEAESVAECQITSVTLAITGEHIQSLNESGFEPISGIEVTSDEISAAIYTASSVKIDEGLMVLHEIPQEFSVDRQTNIKNPLGLNGVRLQAQVHLIACHQDWLNNLKRAVERSGLKVDQVVFSGLASSYSVLTEDEKELGVCLIDFGAGTMDIIVYTNGAIRFSKVIPYAGNRVTDDIAHALTTSRADAERIKVEHGSAIAIPQISPKSNIEVAGIGGRQAATLTKEMLAKVTSARYKELLKIVNKELESLKSELIHKNMPHELIAGIVITGGGAQIQDIAECAKHIFEAPIRIGNPINITGLTDYVDGPQYATAVGVLQYVDDLSRKEMALGQHMNGSGENRGAMSMLKWLWGKIKAEL